MSEHIWTCTVVGVGDEEIPGGADFPMRQAVKDAYRKLTGKEPEFLFSGWGGRLSRDERVYVERSRELAAGKATDGDHA